MAFFFAASGWQDRLRDASFRGVPFSVTDDDASFGRRVQVHEYPKRDKPYVEDMGRATRRFNVNAYVIGDDYMDKRDRVIQAIETAGPGTLVHPQYGELKGSIDGEVRVAYSGTEGRMCRISFMFVESGELSFPVAGAATDQRLIDSNSAFGDAINDLFSEFSLDGVTDFLQSDVIAEAAGIIDDVANVFTVIDSGVSSAMRLLQGDLSVILMPPSAADDFVRALQKAWRAGDRLSGDASDMVTMIRTMAGVTLDPGLAPRGKWPTDSGTVTRQKTLTNLIATTVRAVTISEAVNAVTNLAQPTNNPAARQSSSGGTDVVEVSHPALDATTDQTQAAIPPTYDDLISVREALNTAIDKAQLRITNDELFLRITDLRAALNNDISARLAQVEHTAEITPNAVLPALVLAATWYDDATRETDILTRNIVSHPGFIPVKPLRVPSR